MKKKYSLDYKNITRDVDRLHAVEQILDSLDTPPSPSELEQMASYILYGKDENGKNSIQRGETTDTNKRYRTFQRTEDKNQSLDEILDNPLTEQQTLKPIEERYVYTKKTLPIRRPKYDKDGKLIDAGDSDIPGMRELWSAIDRLDHTLAVNEGKLPPDEDTEIIKDPYRLYQFKHMLIDVKRHQYYLRDSYKPTIHFFGVQPPRRQTYNWDSDTFYWISLREWEKRTSNALLHTISKNLDDYETRQTPSGETEVKWVVRRHNFDWENPTHIKALIHYYSAIYMELQNTFDSWGRTLIYDFDRYFDMCGFSPLREFILTRKIDGATTPTIAAELQQFFGLKYNETHISTIINREIPNTMAETATKHRLLLTTPMEERKQCFTCKEWFPRHKLFFAANNSRKDGLGSNCKNCEKQKRIARGKQTKYDCRNKDEKMFKV